jgi:hypothetical protein
MNGESYRLKRQQTEAVSETLFLITLPAARPDLQERLPLQPKRAPQGEPQAYVPAAPQIRECKALITNEPVYFLAPQSSLLRP